ncbi:hypothetical protein A4H97_10495 [Niastella yeongjuensis]|uniref:Uncharacterized protein n=1 Tax=Niastella yeongjuensis TaxID=354355 RepID=A0A1V9EFD8_9BACT|nr:hypothetical protein [Niastella yeongjuensis]OQP44782.1 hypothetical protein A4H97_10495 [Niastella yeongjuensis]SEP42453.1 hypothetical protein SAMN05660816_06001 [Niastella yeongjuensis]
MESSDLLVIEQIRAGNEAAFDDLFTAWYGKLGFAAVVLGAYVVLTPRPPAKKTMPVVKPDTVQQKPLAVDTIPVVPADTIPVIQPHHKTKQPIPATPAQPARPKMKAVQPIEPVDTTPVKKKLVVPAQQVQPRKHKLAIVNRQW